MTPNEREMVTAALDILVGEIGVWTLHNFGDAVETPPAIACLGLAEEVGEACRATLKQHQGVRGTWEEWQAEIRKELGDVFIKIVDVGIRADIDVPSLILDRWDQIAKRDWKADPIGHGIEQG